MNSNEHFHLRTQVPPKFSLRPPYLEASTGKISAFLELPMALANLDVSKPQTSLALGHKMIMFQNLWDNVGGLSPNDERAPAATPAATAAAPPAAAAAADPPAAAAANSGTLFSYFPILTVKRILNVFGSPSSPKEMTNICKAIKNR
ncbi:uncharacterized protein LY89DRAFT_742976 [Mollisia scopiformis]|uniref:Uncharacterized protein n=1 Tax=Mollisia scopiformis TaxID=149040 RepID=A0A132B523_MOLSC|nr:uncharacterized protein LY89DRAFT_742976 [Mollisia scopiformis]KUJ07343.1 hypothetical protein LY89DRAFT_742976 [Mollisia scopiformis]